MSEGGYGAHRAFLQLQGTGSDYGDFTWAGPVAHTAERSTPARRSAAVAAPEPEPQSQSEPQSQPEPHPAPRDDVLISEVDAARKLRATMPPSSSSCYNGGAGNTVLDGLVGAVFYNGSNDLSYAAFDLDGATTNAAGYFTLGNAAVPGVDRAFAGNLLQNGADAVALYSGNGADFPNNTPIELDNLVDAMVYDTADADDPGLLVLLNPGQPQVDENAGANGDTVSSQRCPDGLGARRADTSSYRQFLPTPDGANECGGEVEPHTIPEIQGAGAVSPVEGRRIVTTGIVTARKQQFTSGSYVTSGFFLQSDVPGPANPDSDGDPATSEGLFVFTSTPPAVAVGDEVTVSGTVSEFFGLTQVSASNDDVLVLSSANTLPAAVTLTSDILSPNGTIDQLERLEAMRVHASSLTTVAPTNTFGEIFTVLTGVDRPFREPGLEASHALPPGSPCCVPRFDENPERLMIDSDGVEGTSVLVATSGVTLGAITGPIEYAFGNYKVLPEAAPSATPNVSASPVPAAAPGELTIGSANLENFYLANGDFAVRVNKASQLIRNVMRSPDIIGLEEIGDFATIQALADRVNADSLPALPQYVAYLEESDDDTEADIDVGFLVKTSRVNVVSVTQEGKGVTYIDPISGTAQILNDRTPLVLRATVAAPDGPAFPVAVIVNHLRSLIDVAADPGDGPRVREKRRKQAEYLADLVQSMQSENLVVIGDFNAFQFSDGYVDSIGTIKGDPAPADQVVLASDDLVNPNLTDLVDTDLVEAAQRYSYSSSGNAQTIDHVLVNANLLPRLTRFAYARNNADFPTSFASDYTRPERISDHDHPVAIRARPRRPHLRGRVESGDLTGWDGSQDDGGDLSVAGAAALDGTTFGLQGLVDDTAGLYVQDDSPTDENRYRARFWFDPNDFDPGTAGRFFRTRIFVGFEEGPDRRLLALVLRYRDGQYAILGRARLDDNRQADTGFFPIGPGAHAIELDWRRATGPDAEDGSFQLWIDGTSMATLTGLDNSLSAVDFVRLGALSVKSGATGTLRWDEFVSRRESYIGP